MVGRTESYKYDGQNYDPPAPILPKVFLAFPGSTPGQSQLGSSAQLDSGADVSAIPEHVVKELSLPKVDEQKVFSYDETKGSEWLPLYAVQIEIPNIGEFVVKALPKGGLDIVIGRDILNEWRLLLDGRAQIFEIS